jgi:diaminohydroxyphosphoribosylaminopyrimidine deaminase/5-amino-6-(5-phosphoribosylamino)uracil reductase
LNFTEEQQYMYRCLQLAGLGSTSTAPNPMVGAVLVHQGRIIGEGYHRAYGGPHAEVNCIASVAEAERVLIPESTLYVSLEPCAHFGKTPPCADLIIRESIRKVVVGTRDPFPSVDGKGIEKLQREGIDVKCGVLESQCRELNRRFFHFHTQHRPWVLLKWAQTSDGIIAPLHQSSEASRLRISTPETNRLVHRWRSEEMAILVGSNTVRKDNPSLTVRHWPGPHPLRMVVDRDETLKHDHDIFNHDTPTIIFSRRRHSLEPAIKFSALEKEKVYRYQVADDASLVHQVLNALYQLGIQSVLVEGGAMLLQHFIDEGAWDEARVITGASTSQVEGLPAPRLRTSTLVDSSSSTGDTIQYFRPGGQSHYS